MNHAANKYRSERLKYAACNYLTDLMKSICEHEIAINDDDVEFFFQDST